MKNLNAVSNLKGGGSFMKRRHDAKERILDNLVQRLGVNRTRKDVAIIAFNLLDDCSARIIATYVGNFPTYEELRSWAITTAQGGIRILPETIMAYNTVPYPLLSFVVESNQVRKPFEAAKDENFIPVTANKYLDVDLGDTWGVEELNGRKFLVRERPDGLKDTLEGKIDYRGPRTWKNAKKILAMVAYKDDVVKFILPDLSVGEGSVIRVKEDGTLMIKDRKTKNVFDRPYATVLEIIKKGGDAREEIKEVRDYVSQIYGPELGKEITKDL